MGSGAAIWLEKALKRTISWAQYFKTFNLHQNYLDKIKDIILILQNWDTDLVIQSYPESKSNVDLGYFKKSKVEIRRGLMLKIRMILIPLEGWIHHAY